MPIYRYALQNDEGPNEHLGFIDIRSDHEAIEFGREVVVDLLHEPDPAHDGASLEITEGARAVDSVPLALHARRKAYS
ncbi:MAG: hypothetical protein WCG00_04080 [Hyphomicrobiales bacterium]